MSYLLFMDESGHVGQNTPYEVRGGIALHARSLWPFVQAMKNLEVSCFGTNLHRYGSEIKGHKLLDRDRLSWAGQERPLDDDARRKHCVAFLTSGAQRRSPRRIEFTAYGQACLMMARNLFGLLEAHGAKVFAAAIPSGITRPATYHGTEYLRKDQVFLLERYFYFLEQEQEAGLLVMDETEKTQDRQFVGRLENYFTRTTTGQNRTAWIVPSPFFVSSDMAYPIQAADVCIYCINWGFRLPSRGMDAATRSEIAEEFGPWLSRLEFRGEGERDGQTFATYGIVYVSDPYGVGTAEPR